jgi:glycerophosphoryl diester phosphodiesterase
MNLQKRLNEIINKKDFLIVSHRGRWGGNIIQNTKEAVMLATRLGADVVEIDICRTSDGEYYLFHEGHERDVLHDNRPFSEISSKEIEQMPVYNSIQSESDYRINRLDEFLEWLPEGILLNIDRAYFYFDDPTLFDILKSSGKSEQFFLKSPTTEKYLTNFSENGEGFHFIPIIANPTEFELYQKYAAHIQTIGYEMLFKTVDEMNDSQKLFTEIKEKNQFVMANAIHLGTAFTLTGGLTDDGALFNNNADWATLVSGRITAIQTDWPEFLDKYREERFFGNY